MILNVLFADDVREIGSWWGVTSVLPYVPFPKLLCFYDETYFVPEFHTSTCQYIFFLSGATALCEPSPP
jgi:hypothetical protein